MAHSIPTSPADDHRFAALQRFFPAALLLRAVAVPPGQPTPRNRRLPRPQVLMLLLALGLLGRWSFPDAWRWLVAKDASNTSTHPPADASSSALTQARQRLGLAPLNVLIRHVVRCLATVAGQPDAFYQGRRLIAVDGTSLSVPDTKANARVFGYAQNQHGDAGFPQLRLLALCELGTHALIHWLIKPFHVSENRMADTLVRHLQPDQLLLADANFYSDAFVRAVQARGTDLLFRVQKGPLLKPFYRLPDGSALVRSYACTADRLADRNGVVLRLIQYQHDDATRPHAGQPRRLLTSLLDANGCPARELIALYHERWEQELVFDEIKTHLNGRKVDIRSQTPWGVVQEVQGLLLMHWTLRAVMVEAAEQAGVAPRQLSLTGTLRVLEIRLPQAASARNPAAWYRLLLAEVGRQRLRPRRERSYPRVVKGARAKFPRKLKGRRGATHQPFRQHILIL